MNGFREFLEGFKNAIMSATGLRTMLQLKIGSNYNATNKATPYNRYMKVETFEETVTVAATGTTYTLTNQLPPDCVVLATQMNFDTAIVLDTAVKVGVGYSAASDLLLSGTVVVKNTKNAYITQVVPAFTPVAITSIVRSSGVSTITKSSHGLSAGRKIRIHGAADISFNGDFTIVSVTTDTFTVANPGTDGSATVAGYYTPFAHVVVQPCATGGTAAGTFNGAGTIRVQVSYRAFDPVQDA